MTPESLAQNFANLFARKFPHITGLNVQWDELETRTISKSIRPDEAPPLPAVNIEPEPAPPAPVETQGQRKAKEGPRRKWKLPDAGKKSRAIKFPDEEIGQVRMLLKRGMRGVEVAKKCGMSQSYVSKLGLDQARRDVEAAPDPRRAKVEA